MQDKNYFFKDDLFLPRFAFRDMALVFDLRAGATECSSAFDLLKPLILPGYRSGRDLLEYVTRRLRQAIDSQEEIKFEEMVLLCRENVSGDELREIRGSFNGNKRMNYKLYDYACSLIGVKTCFPYSSEVSDNGYLEIHKRLFGKEPNLAIDSSGKLIVRAELERRLFDEE